jgi:hypothetical protein
MGTLALPRALGTLVGNETQNTTTGNLVSAALLRAQALGRADGLNLDVANLERVLSPAKIKQDFANPTSNTKGVESSVALFGLFTRGTAARSHRGGPGGLIACCQHG